MRAFTWSASPTLFGHATSCPCAAPSFTCSDACRRHLRCFPSSRASSSYLPASTLDHSAFCTSHLRWRCVRHLHGRCTRFRSRMRCDARRLPGLRTMVECKRPPTGLNEQEPASQTRTGNDDSGDHCDDQSIGADLFGYIGVHENNAEHPKRRMRNSSAQRGFPRDCNVAPMGRTSCPVCATAYTQRKEWLFTVISYRQTVCWAKSM